MLLEQQTEHARQLDEQQAVHQRELAAAMVRCATAAGVIPAEALASDVETPVGDREGNHTGGGKEDLEGEGKPPTVEDEDELVVFNTALTSLH